MGTFSFDPTTMKIKYEGYGDRTEYIINDKWAKLDRPVYPSVLALHKYLIEMWEDDNK